MKLISRMFCCLALVLNAGAATVANCASIAAELEEVTGLNLLAQP